MRLKITAVSQWLYHCNEAATILAKNGAEHGGDISVTILAMKRYMAINTSEYKYEKPSRFRSPRANIHSQTHTIYFTSKVTVFT